MRHALYLTYEILIRLQEIEPTVGDYLSSKEVENGVIIQTTSRNIFVPNELLSKQFNHPSDVSTEELSGILRVLT